jgi:hypothetical protein
MPAPQPVDVERQIIDFGQTIEDLGPRQLAAPALMADLGLPFPPGLVPSPQPLAVEPDPADPMPRADVLVVTWTVAEVEALADVLTPGFNRNNWYRYTENFASYLPEIRNGAPARNARRLGSYFPTRIGSGSAATSVLCVKSELHLNQDGVKTGDGKATLPVKRFFRQMIDEVKPRLVITVGTAGATFPSNRKATVGGMECPPHELGDVMITRGAKFRLSQEFKNEDFKSKSFRSTFAIPTARLEAAKTLLAVHADKLTEPDFGAPSKKFNMPTLVPGFKNKPDLKIDGRDFPEFHPMLTTDFFEFGTSTNGLEQEGCGVEMGDAVLGMVIAEMGTPGAAGVPNWLVIRNASDPQINGDLPDRNNPAIPKVMQRALNMQAHWAVWYYESYGYWTSVNSAIAVWAMTA